jgi:type II secretory pathway pseudopilin PulG
VSVAAGIFVDRPHRRPAALRRLLAETGGFGLVELLIALLILNIGIFATLAAFNSGIVTLRRASRISTASSIAERQMELYRALAYDAIVLRQPQAGDPAQELLDSTHTGDAQWAGAMTLVSACPTGTAPEACKPVQVVSGADGRQYRTDTYIHKAVQTSAPASSFPGREVKIVAVVVRDVSTNAVIVRTESTFDQSTGA